MRTCGCGDVTAAYAGQTIRVCGWTQRNRNLGSCNHINTDIPFKEVIENMSQEAGSAQHA